MDYGERYTEKKISAVNRELRKTYRTAQAELKKKLADFEKRHEKENKRKKEQLAAGEISKQDYKDWLTGQVFIRNQWQANLRQVCKVMHDANRQAMNIVNNSRFDVFAENYNYNAWKAERDIAVSFNVYSAEAVAQLMTDDPQLLPEWKIDQKKDYIWNYNKVNNIVRQGIIQGEGVPEITDRLCSELASDNEAKMRMFARTAINSAQNAGRQKQMEDAAEMGIEVKKRWIATRDSRTRDAHRDMDGEEVPFDQPFKNEYGEIMFPGDPTAKAANVFNCRCSMRTIYPKYEDYSKKWGEGDTVEGVPYEEWKKGKKKRGEVHTVTKEQYEELKANREKVLEQEKKQADEWYDRKTDELMEKYGGSFVTQRISVKKDDSLLDEEKEKKLDEIEKKRLSYNEEKNKLKEERDKKIKDAYDKHDYIFDPQYEYRRTSPETTTEQNAKEVNPNWHYDSFEYTHNCQRCGVAFELRERGFDVEAFGAPSGGYESEIRWLFSDAETHEINGRGHQNTIDVRNKMIEWGEGSRAIVSIRRDSMDGHIFNVEYKNGKFYIIDSQVGACWTDKETGEDINGGSLEGEWTNHVTLYRVDNVRMRMPRDGWIKAR